VSTVHRLLRLLCDEGLVTRNPDTHRYAVGAQLYRIAVRVVDTVQTRELAQPYLESLVSRFNETVVFGMYLASHDALSFVARADGSNALQYRIQMNEPTSLVWGASGKAVLAFLPAKAIDRTVLDAGPSPATGSTLPSRTKLEAELTAIRVRGYAKSESEKLPGARGIAAPVFDSHGVTGSICLTSPSERLPNDDVDVIGAAVAEAAAELSKVFGAT
jgi:DNA-binding IclR family transcriptional regulator